MLYFTLGVLVALLAGIMFLMISGWGQGSGTNQGRIFVIKADAGEIRINENALENIIRLGTQEIKGVNCRQIEVSEIGRASCRERV